MPTRLDIGCPEARSMTRRDALRLGALGVTLPGMLALRNGARAAGGSFGKAKSCIVLFAWGGLSHIDTFDPKPDAGSDIRSAFAPVPTRVPGIQICETLPGIASQMHRMAVVRSVHHRAPSHRSAAYWNLTGHEPPHLTKNWQATRNDWPCLGSLVAYAHDKSGAEAAGTALPKAISLPYTMADGGRANGQDGGFLGLPYDPIIARPSQGKEYEGKSPITGKIELELTAGIDRQRLISRRGLLEGIETPGVIPASEALAVDGYREQALDMLLDARSREAFNVDSEPVALRQAYGDHICGQSVLLARKLTEAGVPLVTVYCAAGDLNGSVGAHFDTHSDGFNKLKNQMLPPLDMASAALLDDLHSRGRLDETLVVWLTEFGRTPQRDGLGGRDHFPGVYSVAFAGGGIAGGQVYGKSDKIGFAPAEDGCGPADLHATIFHALGIDPHTPIHDLTNRPFALTDGKVLPLFG